MEKAAQLFCCFCPEAAERYSLEQGISPAEVDLAWELAELRRRHREELRCYGNACFGQLRPAPTVIAEHAAAEKALLQKGGLA